MLGIIKRAPYITYIGNTTRIHEYDITENNIIQNKKNIEKA